MKQKTFFAMTTVLALVSCSNDETIEFNTGRAIDFRTSIASRATETTTANLAKFYVTAFNENVIDAPYFADLEFTKNENDNLFSSADKYYYPGDFTKLYFHAYAPSKEEIGGTMSIDKETQTLSGFTPATDISKQVDFITASAEGNRDDEDAGVALSFGHRLTQVEIKAKSENKSYDFEVKGYRIGSSVAKGDFNFGTLEWTLSEDKATFEKINETTQNLSAEVISLTGGDNAMLIPQQLVAWNNIAYPKNDNMENKGAYISVLIRITTKGGALVYPFNGDSRDYAWAAIPVNTLWEAGKKYVYTLNFTNGAGYVDPTEELMPGMAILKGEIKFNVNVEEWTSGDAGNNDGEIDLPTGGDNNMDPGETDIEDPFA